MLEKVSLFSSMSEPARAQLEKRALLRKYPKNTILFMEGDSSAQLFIIRSGSVCVYTDGREGRQLVLNYMGADEYFGELSLIDNKPRSASVVTVEDSEMICISRESFRAFLQEHPDCAEVLMAELAQRIRELTGQVKDMALLDVYGRVAQTLMRLCGGTAGGRSLKLTHQDIANMVGASREMVSRVMKELVIGGYIQMQQKHISILKPLPKHW